MVYRSKTSPSRNFEVDKWIVVLDYQIQIQRSCIMVGLRSFDGENRMLAFGGRGVEIQKFKGEGNYLAYLR